MKNKRKWDSDSFMKYYNQGLNDREISEILNISDRTINEYRLKLGLKSNTIGRRAKWTDFQKSVIIGTILGDGYINRQSPLTGFLVVGHSIEQEAWLRKKIEWLGDMVKRKPYYQKQIRKGNENIGVFCYTRSYVELKDLADIFYVNGVKIIPDNISDMFNEVSLAVLYMDDGYCHTTHKGRYSTYYLSTCSFNTKSIYNLINMLKDKWNIKATHQKSNNIVAIASQSKKRFEEIILPYIIPEMMYKIKL